MKLFKKVQQGYIADMLKDSKIRTPWVEKNGFTLLADAVGVSACIIPNHLLYIRLPDDRVTQSLGAFFQDPNDQENAMPVGVDMDGRMKLESPHHTVYAYEKLMKPFLAVHGVRFMVSGPTKPIRFYVEDNCIGLVMPCRPGKSRDGDS